ncbi:hypothetical protein [Thermoanaerobacterium thermosaccharolyticum]|jgi:hypothetical protein|uniref:hypothetical protein n=1 Tax=Thermoanaerobacterium thermosaccharolyticum TaxID=1517 RepID=UPI0017822240|nr:hypothetical protein [Thermoanaerobacterium thermosaccharolyticum]MBE0069718.1 hypothetical protein [Thermoanaerobacterium thermosaccharolyticum]
MRSKVFKMSMFILAVYISLMSGCSYAGVSMNYVKVPDEIYLTGDLNRQKIIELNKKYEETKDYKTRQKLAQEIAEIGNKSIIKIDDKAFINRLINYIHVSKGEVENILLDKSVKNYYSMQFVYKNLKSMNTSDLKEGYIITNVNIIDDYALIPKYDENSNNKITFLKVELSNDILNYIRNYYDSKVK